MSDKSLPNYDLIDISPIPFAHKKAVKNEKGEIIDFTFIHVNSALEKMMGLSGEELTGKSEIDLFGLDRAKTVKAMKQFAARAFQGEEIEIDQYSKTLEKWFKTRVVSGDDDSVLIWFFDITPEKVLLNHSKDIFNSAEISHETITKRAFQISGSSFVFFCEFEEMLQTVRFACTYYRDNRFDLLSDYLLSDYKKIPIIPQYELYQGLQDLDFSLLNPKLCDILNNYRQYTIKIHPIKIENKLLGVFIFFFDSNHPAINENFITTYTEQSGLFLFSERMKNQQSDVEERLQNERAKHYLISKHITDGFAIFENDKITYASSSYSNLTGYPIDEIVGINFDKMIDRMHVEDRERIIKLIKTAHQEKIQNLSYRYRVRKKDGQYIWIADNIKLFYGINGSVKAYINSRDISEQVFYEKELLNSEEKFKILLENVMDSVFVHEIDENGMPGRFIFVNHVAHERLGYTVEEFQNIMVKDIDTSEKARNIPQVMQTLLKEGMVRFQGEHVSKSGKIIPVEISSSLITLDGIKVIISVSHDLTERLKALKREKKDREMLQSILNTLPGMLIVIDSERKILAGNSKMLTEIKGRETSVEQIVGKKCHEVFEEFSLPCENCPLDRLLTSKKTFSEITVQHKKGEEARYLQRFYAPVFNQDVDNPGLIEYVEDITDLIRAQKKAEEANRVKTEFMMNMSHELRTPLNGILGFSNIIESTELSEEQLQYIKNIKTSGYHLLSVINDILDFSKIQTNQLQLKYEEIDLRKLLTLSISLIKKQAFEKGLQTKLQVDPNLPEQIICDQLRLSQVIGNLLYNAVKFTHMGTVTLSAALVKHFNDGIIMQISVRDTGIGIDAKQRSVIFESFTQADSSLTRQFGGTGLGLTISNNILKLMGSQIELESTAGKGSCFSFDLPVDVLKESRVADSEDPQVMLQDTTSFSLMTVDDNFLNLKINTLIIQKHFPNAKIITAADGLEAIKLFMLERPDVILMDIRMPGKDGISATEEIRELQHSDVYIIGISADVQEKTIEEGIRKGLNDYLIKPVIPRHLIEKINQYLIDRHS